MKHAPFKLDCIVDLTRYTGKNYCQKKLDDKSGYDHVLTREDSWPWMGLQWGGCGS